MTDNEQDVQYLNIMQALGMRPDLAEPDKFAAGPFRFCTDGSAIDTDLCTNIANVRDQAIAKAFGAGSQPLCKVQIEAVRIVFPAGNVADNDIYTELSGGYLEHVAGNYTKRTAYSPAWVGFGWDAMYPALAAGVQDLRNGYRAAILKLPIPWIVDFSSDQLNVHNPSTRRSIVELYGVAWKRDITPPWEGEIAVGTLRAMTTGPGYPLPKVT